MTTRAATLCATAVASIALATGLGLATAGTAHAAPVACEVDGHATSDPRVCTPRPEVPAPTTTTTSAPATCAMTAVPVTVTTTTWQVGWDAAAGMWQVEPHDVVRHTTRPLTAAERANCATIGIPGTATPVEGPMPMDPVEMPIPMAPTEPAPVAHRPALATRTFSVVTDTWTGREAASHIEAAYRDGRFGYRELAWAWQTRTGRRQVVERHQQVTVTLPATATTAQWIAAVNRATTTVGDVHRTGRVGHLSARGSITTAWEVAPSSWQLGRDPRTHHADQVFLARS